MNPTPYGTSIDECSHFSRENEKKPDAELHFNMSTLKKTGGGKSKWDGGKMFE